MSAGYEEEGTTTTPFDMVMLNRLDRFHLAEEAIHRLPQLASRAAYLQQGLQRQLLMHREQIMAEGEDPPDIRDWIGAVARLRRPLAPIEPSGALGGPGWRQPDPGQ